MGYSFYWQMEQHLLADKTHRWIRMVSERIERAETIYWFSNAIRKFVGTRSLF
jgi:hypothetical protein